MNPKRPRVNSAFSLMELLVVIAIIAILAALLLQVLSHSMLKARQIQCAGNLHQLGVGLQNFLANNRGYPFLSPKGHADSDYSGGWIAQLERGGLGVSQPPTNYSETGVWRCPAAVWNTQNPEFGPAAMQSVCYYGYNAFGVDISSNRLNSFGFLGHYNAGSSTYASVRESEVTVPSDMLVIGDSFDFGGLLERRDVGWFDSYGNTLARHHGKANIVFCDGHVESPALKFLFADTNDTALVRWNRDHLPHREKLSP